MIYKLRSVDGLTLSEAREATGRKVQWIADQTGSNFNKIAYWHRHSCLPMRVRELEFVLREYGDMILYSDDEASDATFRLSLMEKEEG